MLEVRKRIEKAISKRKACCLCVHNLNLMAEEIRGMYSVANKFISDLKHVLIKNKTNISMYSNIIGLPLIKFPILTRWGTFINCVKFIHENFDLIVKFIEELPKNYIDLKLSVKNKNLLSELSSISYHSFICDTIHQLESDGLEIFSQIQLLFSIRSKLKEPQLLHRFDAIMKKILIYPFL